jgi:hypothetical protein
MEKGFIDVQMVIVANQEATEVSQPGIKGSVRTFYTLLASRDSLPK